MSNARSTPALPTPLRAPLGAVAIGSTLVLVLLGIRYAGSDVGEPGDAAALLVLRGLFPDSRPTALAIDWIGEPAGAITASALLIGLCVLARRWRLAVLAVSCQGLIGAAVYLIKPLVGRTINGGFLAYPSGHTAGATAFAIVAGLLLADLLTVSRRSAVGIVLGLTITVGAVAASAQIWLVAHYATDTIGGFALALAIIPYAAMSIDQIGDQVAPSVH